MIDQRALALVHQIVLAPAGQGGKGVGGDEVVDPVGLGPGGVDHHPGLDRRAAGGEAIAALDLLDRGDRAVPPQGDPVLNRHLGQCEAELPGGDDRRRRGEQRPLDLL